MSVSPSSELDDVLPDNELRSILQPVSIGDWSAPNRLGLAPVSCGLIDDDGFVTGDFASFHELYAAARVGIVFVGGVAIGLAGRASSRSFVLDSTDKAENLKTTISRIAIHGALPIVQLMHAGRQTWLRESIEPLAASSVRCPVTGVLPREMTKIDIDTCVLEFRRAAGLAKLAGAKAVEVHAAHGYLVSSFLSPYSNSRRDLYGGNSQNRFRLLREVLDELVSLRGLAVGVRISAEEFVEGGLTGTDMPDLARRLVAAGVSYISVSAGVYSAEDRIMPPRSLGEATYRHLSAAIRSNVTVPVMLAGNITSLLSASQVIQRRDADIALMGRALLSDPRLVAKTLAGDTASVRPCTMCRLCKYRSRNLPQVVCPHNSTLKAMLHTTIENWRDLGRSVKALPPR